MKSAYYAYNDRNDLFGLRWHFVFLFSFLLLFLPHLLYFFLRLSFRSLIQSALQGTKLSRSGYEFGCE